MMTTMLYQQRILELENEFRRVKERVVNLERCLQLNPEYDRNLLKAQLDLLTNRVRLLKEGVAFYLKLGEAYDQAVFHVLFIETLKTVCPDLAAQLIDRLLAHGPQSGGKNDKTDKGPSLCE